MDRRNFLKLAGVAGATLLVRESVGMLFNKAKKGKVMRVVAFNGDPHKEGNGAYALSLMEEVFKKENIHFEPIHIGAEDLRGCTACAMCKESGECVFADEKEKQWVLSMERADAIILASPCYFGGIAGTMKSFLDRAFYAKPKEFFYGKIGASIVTTPKSGASMTFTSLNQYFSISQISIMSSTYWNNIRGEKIEDLKQDAEGIQVMQTLAKNMVERLKNV